MPSSDTIHDLVGQIYDAAMDGDHWPDLMTRIADHCGGANAALVIVDPDIHQSTVITPRADPKSRAEYQRHWWRFDPISVLAAKARPGRFVSVADLDRDAYFSSAFYNEFRRFTGYGDYVLTTTLFRDGNAFGNFVLQTSRSRDEVTSRTLRDARIVVPHIERAVAIARKFHRLEMQQAIIGRDRKSGEAAVVMVNAAGKRVYSDAKAEDILSGTGPISICNERVRAHDLTADIRLASAIEACARTETGNPCGETLRLPRRDGKPPLTVEVLPYRANPANPYGAPAAAILLIRDPVAGKGMDAGLLRARYGLTPAEAALALEMRAGDGRGAAAAWCGISINTARTHLMRIFEKTGVSRQAELMRVLMDCEAAGTMRIQ
jgi:DNA-binding CsgD family transcriptional regulator